MMRDTTSSIESPASPAAAAKPASGEMHGLALTSRTQGLPSASTRKSTRAQPASPNSSQHDRAISAILTRSGPSSGAKAKRRTVLPASKEPSTHLAL